jgi:endonuclease/exonuclease/phosphatase family metal-dependent hydrolase
MKVISWNVLHGMAIPPAPDSGFEQALSRLQQAVAKLDVDVLGLQEIDHKQSRSFHIHHVQEIAHAMETHHWAFAPTLIGTPGESWHAVGEDESKIVSHDKGVLGESAYGIGLISRIPVKKWHRVELGRSRVGLPLAVPSKRGVGLAYVRDEPRVALVAELENGFTVAVTHLSFVPILNFLQLKKLQRELHKLPGIAIIIGDLNLPWNLPERTGWKSITSKLTYPSWGPKIQFDYLLASKKNLAKIDVDELSIKELGVSDHLAIGAVIKLK